MAYSLHIERDTPIGESEWLRIVEQDKSLTIEHKAVSENPTSNEVIELQCPIVAFGSARF